MIGSNWNNMRDIAHQTAIEHGFWESKPSNEHFLCLVISELMEAVEADRRGERADMDGFKFASSVLIQGRKLHSDVELYNDNIKGSIEEELADAAIRLLDLAGARNVNLNGFCLKHVVTQKKSFTENIYAIVKDLVNYRYSQQEQINYALHQIIRLSEIIGFDLIWHIEKKMEYNKTRAKMHNKKY